MKMVNEEWQRQILLEENKVHTIILENKKYYREIVLELLKQHDGLDGKFILSEKNKELSLAKNSFIITSLFDIDVNSKKILTKIYSSLQKQVLENIVDYNEISTLVYNYFEKLILNNNLNIEQKDEIDMVLFLKLGDFKIQCEDKNSLEQLLQYIKILVELCGVKIIFMIGLHTFFDDKEIELFYKEICLNKINIVNIESQCFSKYTANNYEEEIYIFDKENCEI